MLDKPRQDVLDKPRQEIPQTRDGEQSIEGADTIEGRDSKEMKRIKSREQKENPWKVKQGNPGEGWQPEAWIPKS